MTIVVAKALFGYFEALYDLNRNTITLCGLDVADPFSRYEKYMGDAIATIPRLVPYAFDKTQSKYIIDEKDGLMEFSEDIVFLKADYEAILKKNYCFLVSVKTVRNKFEHKMHGANLSGGYSGDRKVSFKMTYTVNEKDIDLTSNEIISLMKELNMLFSKIQELLAQHTEDDWKLMFPQYYRRLLRFSFLDFNKIYDSDILYIIGKSMYPF